MDDYDNSGASNAAIRLFDWVGDPSNNGNVYPNGAEATTDTIQEVLSLLAEEGGIFEEEEGEFSPPSVLRRLDPQRLCLKNDDFFSPRFENTFRESIQTRIVRRWVASVEKFE